MSATQRFIRAIFANLGTRTAVPDLTTGDGSLSYEQGYGPDYQRVKTDPLAKNPERDKMNQLFYDLTLNQRQYQLRGFPEYVTAAENGGAAVSYAEGAMVVHTDGAVYVSIVPNNTGDPTDATKWRRAFPRTPIATAAGTVDALTAAGIGEPDITALTDGLTVRVRAAGANTSTAPTFAAGTTAAKTIVKGNGLALVAGDIAGAGHWLTLTYDATQDKWVLQNPAAGVNVLGAGQTVQNVLASRAWSTTYTNTTGRPIFVSAAGSVGTSGAVVQLTVNGVLFPGTSDSVGGNTGYVSGAYAIVPPGGTYSLGVSTGVVGSLYTWSELR